MNSTDLQLNKVKSQMSEKAIEVIQQFNSLIINNDISDALNAAINLAVIKRRRLHISGGDWTISKNINCSFNNVIIEGDGWGIGGTKITRSGNFIGFTIQGTSVLNSGTHKNNVEFKNMCLHGGDYTSDLIQFNCASFARFDNFKIIGCSGRAILATEFFDSIIEDCYFSWIGNTDGTLPGIELTGGDGTYEFTNQIHFVRCDFESYRGTVLKGSGNNTNEIFIDGCKFEGSDSNIEHLAFENCNTIFLTNITLTSKGTVGNTISQLFRFQNCNSIYVTGFIEQIGTISVDKATLTQYILLDGCQNVRMFLLINGGIQDITNTYCVQVNNVINSGYSININGEMYNPGSKMLSSLTYETFYKNVRVVRNGESALMLINTATGDTNPWYVGRIQSDGANASKFLINHGETNVINITNSNNVKFQAPTWFLNSMILYNSSTAPWSTNGSIYYDTSNSIPTERKYSNNAHHRIGYSSAAPVDGTWAVGDIIYNTVPASCGYVGWVCITAGTPGTWKTFGLIS